MKLNGKIVNFLGDSITAGVGTSCEDGMFVNILSREKNIIAKNYGISCTRIAQQSTCDGSSYCERFDSMDDDADIVVIFGGTNDYGHGDAPFGKSGDKDYTTFCGACEWIINEFNKKYSNKTKLVIMTPIHRESENNPSTGNSLPLKSYVNAIKEAAKRHNIPVLDLYNICEIFPDNKDSKEKYCPDGLHPNDDGNAIIAKLLSDFIENNL